VFTQRLFGEPGRSALRPQRPKAGADVPDWLTKLRGTLSTQPATAAGVHEPPRTGPGVVVQAAATWALSPATRSTWYPWTLYRQVWVENSWPVALDVASDNVTFAAGVWDRSIRLFDLASGLVVHTFRSESQLLGPVRVLRFAESAPHLLYSGAADKRVLAWDTRTGRIALRLVGHRASVDALAVHPRLTHVLFSGSADEMIRVWDTRVGGQCSVHELGGHRGGVRSLVGRALEPQLLSASDDCTIRSWDIVKGVAAGVCTRHAKPVIGLSSCWLETDLTESELERLVSVSADGARMWKLPAVQLVDEIPGPAPTLSTAAVSEDGQLVCGDLDGQLHWWNAAQRCWQSQSAAPQATSGVTCSVGARVPAVVLCIAFDRSATRLLTGCHDGAIRMWRLHDEYR
jgi:pleiotropic regulator 1